MRRALARSAWPLLVVALVSAALSYTLRESATGGALRTAAPVTPVAVHTAAAPLTPSDIQSFVVTETADAHAGGQATQGDTQRWYEAPNRWRVESAFSTTSPRGQQDGKTITVSDGTDLWSDRQPGNAVQINQLSASWNGFGDLHPFGPPPAGLGAFLKQAGACSTPVLQGSDTVAGRPVYVIDLGVTKCPSATAPEINGRRLLWVDTETLFVLKSVQYSGVDGTPLATTEVTHVQYNVPIDPARFSFAPPPGASIQDFRPKPAPSASQDAQQLQTLARQVTFPIFAPHDLPPGLVPRQPRLDPIVGLQLDYVPLSEASTTSVAEQSGVTIREQAATYTLVANWTVRAETTSIAGREGWLRRGVHNADGSGADSAALVLRDGTLIAVSSFTVAPEELVVIAASLEPVPGGHPPLPEPTPPTLAALRHTVAYPLFVPLAAPAGLTPEPPVGGDQPTAGVTISYRAADGSVALRVLEGPAGCCLAADIHKSDGETVSLPNGAVAHLLDEPPQYGGPILWWEQDGAYIALSGPQLRRGDLVAIAASMSKTAELGTTELPAGPDDTFGTGA